MSRNFCSSCGARLTEGAAHCTSCGARVETGAPAAAGTSPVAPPMQQYGAPPMAQGHPYPPNMQPPAPGMQQQPAVPPTPGFGSSILPADFNVAHALTTQLGLEKVENFSPKTFFGDVFKRRTPEEVEEHLAVGFRHTTPMLSPKMAEMPAPWLFARTLFYALVVFIPLYYIYTSTANTKMVPGLIMIGTFAVPVAVLVLFFELNTPKNVSMARVMYLFMTGAAASLLISIVLFRATGLIDVLGAPAAGFVEEPGKLAAMILITRSMTNDRYPYALNGLLFGAAVGAGFAAFETAGYALEAGIGQGPEGMMESMKLRGALAPFMHVAWTAMVGFAYWRQRALGMKIGDILASPAFLKIFVSAMIIHALWNTNYYGPFYAKFIVLGIVAWIIIISMVQIGLKDVGRRAAAPSDLGLPQGPAAAASAPVLTSPEATPGQG